MRKIQRESECVGVFGVFFRGFLTDESESVSFLLILLVLQAESTVCLKVPARLEARLILWNLYGPCSLGGIYVPLSSSFAQ